MLGLFFILKTFHSGLSVLKDRFMTTPMWSHYLFVYSDNFYRGILMRSYTESNRLNNNQCGFNCEVQYSINSFWIFLIAYFVQSIIFWVNLNFMKIINDIFISLSFALFPPKYLNRMSTGSFGSLHLLRTLIAMQFSYVPRIPIAEAWI